MVLSTIILSVLPALGQMADLITTRKALAAGLIESNPVMKSLVKNPKAFVIFKSVFAVFLLWFTFSTFQQGFMLGLSASILTSIAGFGPAIINIIRTHKFLNS